MKSFMGILVFFAILYLLTAQGNHSLNPFVWPARVSFTLGSVFGFTLVVHSLIRNKVI